MNRVINSFINTVKKIKFEIFGKISDFIFLYVEKIKSEMFGKISDVIFLHAEKIKSEIFVPFGHRSIYTVCILVIVARYVMQNCCLGL